MEKHPIRIEVVDQFLDDLQKKAGFDLYVYLEVLEELLRLGDARRREVRRQIEDLEMEMDQEEADGSKRED